MTKARGQFSGPLFEGTPRHRCPPWCHRCPDLEAIVRESGGDPTDPLETTMPGCMGGSLHGIDGCHCSSEDRQSMATFTARIRLLRHLVTTYPTLARMLVARYAPPREAPPRLVIMGHTRGAHSGDGGAA